MNTKWIRCLRKVKLLPITLGISAFLLTCNGSQASSLEQPAAAAMDSAKLEQIDKIVNAAVDAKKIGSLSIAIARNGHIAYLKSFGVVSSEGQPANNDTLYLLCSTSKINATLAILRLQEQGLVSLDDPVSKFIPEFANQQVAVADNSQASGYHLEPLARPVTVRHLLSMTSGITGYGVDSPDQQLEVALDRKRAALGIPLSGGEDPAMTLEQFAKLWAQMPLKFQPGEGIRYGHGVDLAGRVIEVATGLPLDQALKTLLWGPMQMTKTAFYPPESQLANFSSFWQVGSDGSLTGNTYPVEPDFGFVRLATNRKLFSVGGGVHSTANDYAQIATMLTNGGVVNGQPFLSKASLQQIGTAQSVFDPVSEVDGLHRYGLTSWIYVPGSAGAETGATFRDATSWIDTGLMGNMLEFNAERNLAIFVASDHVTYLPPGFERKIYNEIAAIAYSAVK